jgi:hypothetical protein
MIRLSLGVAALLCLHCLFAFSPPNTLGNRHFFDPPSDSTVNVGFTIGKLSDHALYVLNNRYALLNRLIERQTEKMLRRMEKKEQALQQELQSKDSVKARALFAQTAANYQQLLTKLQTGSNVSGTISLPTASGFAITTPAATINPLHQYIPGVDSMQTALRFLGQTNLNGSSIIMGLPFGQLQSIQTTGQQLLRLQSTLQNANDAQAFLQQREQYLKAQLMNSGLARQLLGINKEAYYYQVQLSQYKDMLNSPEKIQQTVLSAVRQAPAFRQFWQKNSYWSRLFPAPAPGMAGTPQELAGLQTREQVQQEVQRRLGITASAATSVVADKSAGGSSGGISYLQQQMQSMQSQLQAIKKKLAQFGTGSVTGLGGGNMTAPDFQPNDQRTKTFLKRLQFSVVVQNSPGTSLLPAISSVGLNIGYKINDKSTVGIGGSYLLGLGSGLDHIRLSNQGVGLRSFVNIKAKGSIWITGGLEYNYLEQFTSIRDIPNVNVWQRSALVGLTKTYRIGKKENNIQLLYDLLANSEVPRAQPFRFRMGWGF